MLHYLLTRHSVMILVPSSDIRACVRVLLYIMLYFLFFFFQAEDGIRDLIVTGVQTCALPILPRHPGGAVSPGPLRRPDGVRRRAAGDDDRAGGNLRTRGERHVRGRPGRSEIGRASCRERV